MDPQQQAMQYAQAMSQWQYAQASSVYSPGMAAPIQPWGPALPVGYACATFMPIPVAIVSLPDAPLSADMALQQTASTEKSHVQTRPVQSPASHGKGQGKNAGKSGSKGKRGRQHRQEDVPKPGISISRCSAGDLSRLQDLWLSRGGQGSVVAAWKVDNPSLVHEFKQRRDRLNGILGREADVLEGFHGTPPKNVIPICENGFDNRRRSNQAYGDGEYFAKNPMVSVRYSCGGQYMLVCRLTLGIESSSDENSDGDHIWVPRKGYYVVKEPTQVLPQFIIEFESNTQLLPPFCVSLEKALRVGYSTKSNAEIVPVPRQQRPCVMSREAADVLWIGFLHAHLSDESLRQDVSNFLREHAAKYLEGAKIQIVKGYYKKAHATLRTPMPRALVHSLNSAPFLENGIRRTICVEDAHGSPGQKCPRYIAGYCRGQNLRYTHPCFCDHPCRPTEHAPFALEPIDLDGAKGTEIRDKFMSSAPFHNGHPRIVGIKAVKNKKLSECHNEFRHYLRTKHMEEPAVQELYHGTNNNTLDSLYQHGPQPPSDTEASELCPVSGGKGLCTTLCDNTCKHCTERHEWNKCHMFGLGIYLADKSNKSHRYVSQPQQSQVLPGKQTYRMLVCSVLGKAFQIEGHLQGRACMHDVVNVRSLDEEELDTMVEQCRTCSTEELSIDNREGSAEKSDLLFIKGLGCNHQPGFSVLNNEFIAFHPHQCLPKYEIEYELN